MVRVVVPRDAAVFYGSFGFVKDSELYLEDGIPHIEMLRAGNQNQNKQDSGGHVSAVDFPV